MCERPVELEEITVKLRNLGSGIVIKDRRYRLKLYPKCFIGSEAVKWMITTGYAPNDKAAIKLGQKLLDFGIIHHVKNEHNFKNDYLFYRFAEDEVAKGPSATEVSSTCGAYKGWLMKKGKIKWNTRYCVLLPSDQKLYYFDNELSGSPRQIIDLAEPGVTLGEFDYNTPGYYCFSVGVPGALHIFAVRNAREQDEWMTALSNAGIGFQESPELGAVTAQSIFDFSVYDIHMTDTPLSTLKGNVCLIVNVASK